MKPLILIATLLLITNSAHGLMTSATIGGSEGTGGGDPCEERIQFIRDNIKNWISGGGPTGFKNMPITVEEYSTRMNKFLATTKEPSGAIRPFTQIECVHHPIEVQGLEKVCRFDTAPRPKITCYYEAFLDKATMNADEQTRLIHHEYAGLAKLEEPWQSQSQYDYSKQLVEGFMADFKVRMLSITRIDKPEFGPPKIKISDIREGNYSLDMPVATTMWDMTRCGMYIQTNPEAREIKITPVPNPAYPTNCINAERTIVLKCPTDEVRNCVSDNERTWWYVMFQALWANSESLWTQLTLTAKAGNAFLLEEKFWDVDRKAVKAKTTERFVFHDSGAPALPKHFITFALNEDQRETSREVKCLKAKEAGQEFGLRACHQYSANCQLVQERWSRVEGRPDCGYAAIYDSK
jgi:hypothetical protein